MTYVVFENPGTFDLRLIKTFGVNVKPNTNHPIGYFGTGLKYAVAIVLRNGGEFWLQDGEGMQYQCIPKTHNIRGKDFPLVELWNADKHQELPFTLELGKNWQVWHAYRELYSNMVDENGHRYETENIPSPQEDVVRFIINSAPLLEIYYNHSNYFLDRHRYTFIDGNKFVEAFDHSTHSIYLQGITVYQEKLHCLYTYNFLSGITLSEERSSLYEFQRNDTIRDFWAASNNEHALERIVTASELTLEGKLDFSNVYLDDTMMKVATDMMNKRFSSVRPSIVKNVHGRRQNQAKFDEYPLTAVQDKMMVKAKSVLTQFGYDMTRYPIISINSLGQYMGMADDGKIYITQLAFNKGMKQVVATLLEEWIHLDYLVHDCTREMQDILFDKIVNMMEDKLGEPI